MQTLSQLVKRHFPGQEQKVRDIVSQSAPAGRVVLHDFLTRGRVEVTVDGTPVVHIGKEFPLEELCYIERDLEEEQGFLPTSILAATNPRIKADKYVVFGTEIKEAHTLFIVDQQRADELADVPGLHRLQSFPTYRLFADRRDDIDPVTKLFTRNYLERQVSNILSTKTEGNYVVIGADLDHFKRINESYGAPKGDLALRIVGTELSKALGKFGFGSRRHYGDETLSLVVAKFFDQYQGGALQWAKDLNKRLSERSIEIGPDLTLQLTFGLYPLADGGTWGQAKVRADQALVYARTRRETMVTWTPSIPTLDEMQSGRHTRYADREVAQLQVAAKRAFPKGITPDQAVQAQEIVDDLINKSEPVRQAGNRKVLEHLAAHMLIANPRAIKHYSPDRVWASIHQTRSNLGLLTDEEKKLAPERMAPYLSERLNLERLLTGPNKAAYNAGLEAYNISRYDDTIKSITASSSSQELSRFIVSGNQQPATGELTSIGDLLTLLTVPLHFAGQGLVTLSHGDLSTTLYFDNEQFDISPRTRELSERKNRVANHLGLQDVIITQVEPNGTVPHYTFTTRELAKLEPILAAADQKVESDISANVNIFRVPEGYGVNIPHLHELLTERVRLDSDYAARLYGEPEQAKDGTGTFHRSEISRERAVELVKKHYKVRGRENFPTLPIFHGDQKEITRLISDLYIARDVYLTERDGTFSVNGLRVPDVETDEPSFDEVVVHVAREFSRLLQGAGPLTYRIEKAQPLLKHTPHFRGLQQLVIPIAARYEELFVRQGRQD